MAVNSEKNYYINPKALSFTPNYQGYRNIVYVSIVSNAAIKAYHNDIDGLGYGIDAEYQTWRLSGTTTGLGTASAYFIYARLSRTKQTADIIFSVRDYTVEGGYSYTDSDGNAQTVEKSDEYFYIKIGSLTETDIAGEDATVNRVLTYVSGELGTDKQINEKSDSVFEQMFEFVSSTVGKVINVKKPFHSIKVAFESVFNGLATFVKGFVLGEKEVTAIATSEDSYSEERRNSTLPTTGYVQKEIEALDDHFLIKDDPDAEQSVAGPVTFEQDVTVQGDHAVGKSQTIGGNQTVSGNQTIGGTQDVGGLQTLHGGFQTPNFNNAAGQITGAHLTPDGKLYISGLKANNFEIDQLIFNVVKAQGGEYVYSTSCEIESCIYAMKDGSQLTPDVFYELPDHDWQQIAHVLITLKEDEFTQYGNPFEVGDIIYGKVNQVQESGKHAVGGECIMHITAVEDNTLNITAQLYQVGEEGVVGNIPPVEDMVIAHRGNKDGVQGRTTSFYISTITGNLVMLYNVTTPTLSAVNYGASFGKLPYDLYVQVLSHYAGLQPDDPAVYAKLLVTENWIQMDHLGQPIKFEVYRGDWRLDVAQSDKPYLETTSTYDTVTHNGVKWRIRTSNTKKEPNEAYGDWERITDANITMYTLVPSSNIIYIRDGGVVTPSKLDVAVKSTTSLGEDVISDQVVLVEHNFTVWYTIDGGEERKMLVLGGATVLSTEDGISVFVTETASEEKPFYLEGESIDLSQVTDNITLHLVEDYPNNPTDRASYVIPVVKDGAAPLGLDVTPSSLSVPVDATTLATAGVRTLKSVVRIKQGISYLGNLDEYSLSLTFTMTDGTILDAPPLTYYEYIDYDNAYDVEGNRIGWEIKVVTKDNIGKADLLEQIGVIVKHNESVVATGSISFVYLERGIAGPMGKDGPMIFPCGTWKAGAEYKMVYLKTRDANGNEVIATDEDGKKIILAKPFVYYKNENNDEYYVLNDDVPAGSDIQLSNTQYWKPFTKIQYIFTEALMAQYARLASAVFYGDYMFSVEGIDINGNVSDESKHQEDYLPMFVNVAPEGEEPDMRFSGNFTPNLFIDFKTGAIKMNKISEPFYQAKNLYNEGGSNIYKIDLNNGHNVTVQQAPYMVCMPNPTDIINADGSVAVSRGWDTDGVRSCIIAQPNFEYQQLKASGYLEWDGVSQEYAVAQYLTIFCADGRIMDARSYKDGSYKPQNMLEYVGSTTEGTKTGQGYFVINGQLSKFLVLEPSAIVTLRSCTTKMGEENVVYWYVENQSDFERVKLTVYILDQDTFECNYDGAANYGTVEVAFGSKYLRTLLDAKGQFANVSALEYSIDLDSNIITNDI